jgi:hypothetical protein
MHTDIYLTIGLYLPIPFILNYLLAKKVNREYFWKFRLERDYSVNNPLNLSYSVLYKLNYEYIPTSQQDNYKARPRPLINV